MGEIKEMVAINLNNKCNLRTTTIMVGIVMKMIYIIIIWSLWVVVTVRSWMKV